MILYDENMPAPNPRRVRIYLAEKGIEVPRQRVALAEGAHKAPAFLAKNSLGQVPALELDDGTVIAESVAICRYFEALHPEPPLFGATPAEVGIVEMWLRRIELRLMAPLGQVWINVHPFTAPYAERMGIRRFTDFGEENRKRYADALRWLGREIADRAFIAGPAYTMADIIAQSVVDFGIFIDERIPDDAPGVRAWHERVSARPSASA